MPTTRVTISPENAEFARRQVDGGDAVDIEDVVNQVLSDAAKARREFVLEAAQVGRDAIAAGDFKTGTPEDFIKDVRAKLAARRQR